MVSASRIMLERMEQRDRQAARTAAERAWLPEDFVRLGRAAIIALNHDSGHDGKTNSIGGNYVPGNLERCAYEFLFPILRDVGLSVSERRFVHHVTLMTDPLLPGEILKYGAALHENRIVTEVAKMERSGKPVPRTLANYADAQRNFGAIMYLPRAELERRMAELPRGRARELRGLLRAVEANPELVRETLLIKAADMAGSFGLSAAANIDDERRLHQEMKAANPSSPDIIAPDGRPIPQRDLYVMLNFVGARRQPDGTIRAAFMHPTADRLFGEVLGELEKSARAQLTPDKMAEIESSLIAHTHHRTTVPRQARDLSSRLDP